MSVDPLNQANYKSITAMINVKDVEKAAQYYADHFGFEILMCMKDEEGKGFADMQYRDSKFMILEEDEAKMAMAPSTVGGNPVSFYVYVNDVDSYLADLEAKEVNIVMPLTDMPWGDRCAVALDPEGHVWMFATHKKDVM